MGLKRFGRRPVDWGALVGQFQPHQPPAAGERLGGKLSIEHGRIAIDIGLGQPRHVEGVIRARRRRRGQTIGALAHLAAIAPVDHHGAHALGRLVEETFDVGAAAEDHTGRS